MISKEFGKLSGQTASIHFFEDQSEPEKKGFPKGTTCYWTIGSEVISSPMQFVDRVRQSALDGELAFDVRDMHKVRDGIHKELMQYQKKMIDAHFKSLIAQYADSNIPNKADVIGQIHEAHRTATANIGSIDPDGVYRDPAAMKQLFDEQK